jgi:hypothetical protein
MSEAQNGGRLIEAARLYGRTSKAGRTYLAGRMGGLRVLIFEADQQAGGEHSHVLLIGAAEPREREGGER